MNTSANGFRWKKNIYAALVRYLLLAMVFYTLCRIGFYLFNTEYFPGITGGIFIQLLAGGLVFDLPGVLYSNALLVLLITIPHPLRYNAIYKKIIKWVFVIVNSVAVATNVIDFIYYRVTLARTTLTIFSQFQHEQNIPSLFLHFLITYWYLVLLFIVLVWCLKKLADKIDYEGPQIKSPWLQYITSILLIPVVVVLFVGGVRGGFKHSTRPITLSNAPQYSVKPQYAAIVLNTPFALIRTATTEVIKKVDYYSSDDALNKVFTPLHVPTDTAAFKPDNVVIFILESFSKEFISAYNKDMGKDYKGYAPFLDSLISNSCAYQYSFANGHKSIEAMPSVLCSLPSLQVPYILSQYSGDKVNSIASLLKSKGYYSAFFHGAPNGSMGFLAFSKTIGYDDYFGKNEYNNDKEFDGIWAIWDEPFLQFFANKMNTFRQPFLSTVFTASSHDPFILPKQYDGVFKGGPLPVQRTIQYSDKAIREFFQTASKMPWFKNTLFVFTADHVSFQSQYAKYHSVPGTSSIPIFFYKPGGLQPSFKQEMINQIDIMPTVLGYLHYNKPYIAFGRNIFAEDKTPYAINYLNNTYNYFWNDYLLMYSNDKPVGLYNYKTDFTQQHNLINAMPDTTRVITNRLQAFIQQYNNRIVDNNLTTEGSQLQKTAGQP
ncbi:MAG: sulfatase-like hydrolase/transferase [Parafilimonas sp.]|nr:sulfatase-like hydrolase/transferase [Parafilimonas sp.]